MIAPGRRADIVLLDDLEACAVSDGDLRRPDRRRGAVRDARAGRADRARQRQGDAGYGRATSVSRRPAVPTSVIGVIPGKIITEHLRRDLPARGGARCIDLAQDVIKVAVVARHGINRNIGCGFVQRLRPASAARSPRRSGMTATTSASSAPTTATWRLRSTASSRSRAASSSCRRARSGPSWRCRSPA